MRERHDPWSQRVLDEISAEHARIRQEYDAGKASRSQPSLFDAEPSRPVVDVAETL